MDQRAIRIRRISEGIKKDAISSADLLTLAVKSSSSKSKSSKTVNNNGKFDRDVADTAGKENVPRNLPVDLAMLGMDKNSLQRKARSIIGHHHPHTNDEDVHLYDHIVGEINGDVNQQLAPPATQTETTIVMELEADEEDEQVATYRVQHDFDALLAMEEEDVMESVPPVSVSSLRDQMFAHFLSIFNEGTYEQLTRLKYIGSVRATKLVTYRNSGQGKIEGLEELEEILDMNSKMVQRMILANMGPLAYYM